MAALACVLPLLACGGDGDDVENRLLEVLDLADAEVECPRVDDAGPGDLATCVVTQTDGERVEVDIEFREDGSFAVVRVDE